MDPRARLFSNKKIYDLTGTSRLFTEAIRENVLFHQTHCSFYRQLLQSKQFDPATILTEADCAQIPSIPATFFKRHQIFSIPPDQDQIFATSSGTKGEKSQLYFDQDSVNTGIRMAVNCFRWHGLISIIPTNYIMLGYEPNERNQMGAVKTAMGATRFAPAKKRVFMLRSKKTGYQVDIVGAIDALKRFEKQHLPVRLLGFPAYLYLLLKTMQEEGIHLKLNRKSFVLLGGGWKQFDDQVIEKKALYQMAETTLGISSENCRDFYSALEHGVAYAECKNHHFHVPIWSRVIIRDVQTLEPVGYHTTGLLSFVTPLVRSAPLVSVTMGDLAVLHENCGCGIPTPYFKVMGRAGKIRNCAVAAWEWAGAK